MGKQEIETCRKTSTPGLCNMKEISEDGIQAAQGSPQLIQVSTMQISLRELCGSGPNHSQQRSSPYIQRDGEASL